jgi:cytochrome c5
MSLKHFLFGAFVLILVSALAVGAEQSGPEVSAPAKKPAIHRQSAQQQDGGERVFEQNCSRCHNAPDGFSPRISGAIVRHMRVRASLSQEQEKALLRFFNP